MELHSERAIYCYMMSALSLNNGSHTFTSHLFRASFEKQFEQKPFKVYSLMIQTQDKLSACFDFIVTKSIVKFQLSHKILKKTLC